MLVKCKLNCMKVLISKALIDSKISQDEFVLINNVQKEYRDIKEEIKNLKYLSIFLKQCYRIFWREEKIQKEKTQMLERQKTEG